MYKTNFYGNRLNVLINNYVSNKEKNIKLLLT